MEDVKNNLESNVRSYSRTFPLEFTSAKGSRLESIEGKPFLDFFSGAGTLNYGHNNPKVKEALIQYLEDDGILHSLDMHTTARQEFISAFDSLILKPRELSYKMQFCGPSGTGAVEAALKLARKATGRHNIVSFTGAYHGHTLGALAVTSNQHYQNEAFSNNSNVTRLPFEGYQQGIDSFSLFKKMLTDPGSGVAKPAAVILETIQCEGGINVASIAWLQKVAAFCKENGILLIVDDIQVGCGRTGNFFSFEHAGICPDIVCLSKSLGGGLPIALLLLRPEIDVWCPGEHTGTFRGNNLAFVAGTALLDYWKDRELEMAVAKKAMIVESKLRSIANQVHLPSQSVRGRGLVWGLDLTTAEYAKSAQKMAFSNGLIIETAGALGQVLKLIPPLTISETELAQGLKVLEDVVIESMSDILPLRVANM